MAEKDKYAEEMLTDEELDNVVGGNWFENYFDAVELYNRGLIENLTRVTTRPANLMDILHKMGYTGYKCDYNEVNIYVNKSGEKTTQYDFWKNFDAENNTTIIRHA